MKNKMLLMLVGLILVGCNRTVYIDDYANDIAFLKAENDLRIAEIEALDARITALEDIGAAARLQQLEDFQFIQYQINESFWARIRKLQLKLRQTNNNLSSLIDEVNILIEDFNAFKDNQESINDDLQNQIDNITLTPGPQGPAGKSAYQIWLDAGNSGSEEDFLLALQGAQGPKGETGPSGPAGSPGANGTVTVGGSIAAVQLCPGDSNKFKEYGFIIGDSLYAVYYMGSNAFMAKLNAGESYETTNEVPCRFEYANDGDTITLSNSSGSFVYDLDDSGSPTSPTPLAGSCLVEKTANYNTEQQFKFSVSGMSSYLSYSLMVKFNQGGQIKSVGDSNGGSNSYSNPVWTINPMNSSEGFDFYVYHNSGANPNVTSAKIVQNGQELFCTVKN